MSTKTDPTNGCSSSNSDSLPVKCTQNSNSIKTELQIKKVSVEYDSQDGETGDNIIVELDTSQHYTIADNVIIEHIELAEGECAETEEESSIQNDFSKVSENSVISKWTDGEKRKFLSAVKLFGIHDNAQIASYVSTKSTEEITEAINYFTKKAIERISQTKGQSKNNKRKGKPTSCFGNPLMEWLHVLNENLSVEELETVTGDALRIIADCEHFPLPSNTTNVDFRNIYFAIASALDGRPIPELSNESLEILRRAITEVSLSVNHLKGNGFDDHIKNLTSIRSLILNQVKANDKQCPLRYRLAHLISSKKYNPLNVPTDLTDPYSTSGIVSNKNVFE